jgi:iron complex outermembrane recepter protein
MRSLYYLIWFSLFGLLVAPTALAEESRSPLAPLFKGGSGMKVPLDRGRTALKVLLLKGDLGGSLAQNPQITKVTGVEVKQTSSGAQVILKTPSGQPKLVPLILPEGNNLVVDILDATLAFSIRNGVTQTNPAPGIREVRVSKIDATSIRVTIAGEQQAPSAEVVPGSNLVLSVTPEGATTEQTQADEEIEIVVTGEREEDNYAVPNANVGTRTDAAIKDVPQSIQVVPQQVIKDQGATQLQDALRNSDPAGQGFGRNVFENGLRGLRGGDGSRGDSGEIDLTNIEQVEILRGPSSVLYGTGAAGGLVNLTTKQPLERPFYRVEGSLGNRDFYRTSIDFSGPINSSRTVLYRLNASYQNTDFLTDFANREDFSIFPTLSFRFNNSTKLTLEAAYTEFSGIPEQGLPLPVLGTLSPNPLGEVSQSLFLGEPDFNKEEFWSGYFGYRFEYQIDPDWKIKNRFQYAFANFNLQSVDADSFDDDNRTVSRIAFVNQARDDEYNLQTEMTGKIKTGTVEQSLLIGVDLRRFNQSGGPSIAPEAAAPIDIFNPIYGQPIPEIPAVSFDEKFITDSAGIFAQNSIAIGEPLIILLGGRFDWIKSNFEEDATNAFSPRVGIVYQPIQPVSLYANWSRSFEPTEGLDRFGNPFIPTRGEQFEVGVKTEFLNGKVASTLSAYQITRQNDLVEDPNSPSSQDFQIQIGEQRSRGIIFDLNGEPVPGLNLFLNYAFTDGEITVDPASGLQEV